MPAGSSIGLPDILCARMFAIACGYADGDDLDRLRSDRRSSSPAGGCPTPEPICARSHRLALGERALVARPHPPDEGHGRSLLRSYPVRQRR